MRGHERNSQIDEQLIGRRGRPSFGRESQLRFGFSREPEDELRLFRDLAARGLLPVEAWRLETAPTWDRPFTDLRAERARVLGLG